MDAITFNIITYHIMTKLFFRKQNLFLEFKQNIERLSLIFIKYGFLIFFMNQTQILICKFLKIRFNTFDRAMQPPNHLKLNQERLLMFYFVGNLVRPFAELGQRHC